jgi:hypothetical protein
MARLEALEGYGVLALAVALMAAFLLRLAVPPPEVLRAAGAPAVAVALPEARISLHH